MLERLTRCHSIHRLVILFIANGADDLNFFDEVRMPRPTLKDIAKIAGVHESTVSVALRGDKRIPESTQERIKAIADELGYRPNLMARGLANRRTHTIGIITPDFSDLYYVDLVRFQKQWLSQNGYCMMLTDFSSDSNIFWDGVEQLLSRGVDGLISNAAFISETIIDKLVPLAHSGLPISTIGTRSHRHPEFDHVVVDEEKAAYDITSHLISLGHRRIVIPASRINSDWGKGYIRAFEENGIKPDLQLFIPGTYENLDWLDNVLSFKQRPTAIMAKNDQHASDIIFSLIDRGYHIPEDISVTGVNDEIFASRLRIPLTTYRLPKAQIAHSAVSMLHDRIEKKRTETREEFFSGELVIRETTRATNLQAV